MSDITFCESKIKFAPSLSLLRLYLLIYKATCAYYSLIISLYKAKILL